MKSASPSRRLQMLTPSLLARLKSISTTPPDPDLNRSELRERRFFFLCFLCVLLLNLEGPLSWQAFCAGWRGCQQGSVIVLRGATSAVRLHLESLLRRSLSLTKLLVFMSPTAIGRR